MIAVRKAMSLTKNVTTEQLLSFLRHHLRYVWRLGCILKKPFCISGLVLSLTLTKFFLPVWLRVLNDFRVMGFSAGLNAMDHFPGL